MKLGVTIFATDQCMDVVELARESEARGFHSLYIPEHTHIPTSRRTPPPTGDAVLAEEYKRTLDPFVALGACAAVTQKLVLGTGIALVAQRDPIVFAKEIATLDVLSKGRAVLGIGFGWNEDEMEDHGVTFKERRDVAREKMLAMQALWANEVASFEGQYVKIPPCWSWPKPVQKPRVPILIGGGGGPKLFAHIAEYADGWIPIGGAGVRELIPQLHAAVEARGRDPRSIRVIPFGTLPTPGKLDYYASLGIDEVVLRIPSAPRDTVMPMLDEFRKLLPS
ncbi:MAG: LLM class F420-dependent oxidoreductase [Deltaproteobacteria bacterium]|nr:LLM class F420-dependent oxidoreductase [Deltaproteobacteria bacterium]